MKKNCIHVVRPIINMEVELFLRIVLNRFKCNFKWRTHRPILKRKYICSQYIAFKQHFVEVSFTLALVLKNNYRNVQLIQWKLVSITSAVKVCGALNYFKTVQ